MTTRQSWRQHLPAFVLLLPVSVLLALLFVIPLAIMAIYSMLEPGLYGGVVWNFYPYNYGRILGWPLGAGEEFDPVYLGIFAQSLMLAIVTVVASLAICFPAALWVSRLSDTRRNFVLFLITLPFFANLLIRIYAWLLILRPTGFLNTALQWLGVVAEPLQLIFTGPAIVVGLVYVLVPFMFMPLYASLEKLDPTLLEASTDLGASHLQTLWRVIVPLARPGIIAGCILVFIPAVGNFIVPNLLGGAKVLMSGNLIEQQFLKARNWPFGAAIAMLVMAAVLVLMTVYARTASRERSIR